MAPAAGDGDGNGNGNSNGAGFTIREMGPDDVTQAGEVYYNAFFVDSTACGVPTAFSAPSLEAGCSLIAAMVAHPLYYKLAAVDSHGKVIGIAVIDMEDKYVNGVGPVAVSPDSANRGVGKALMKAIIQHAHKSPSIRLNTSGSNRKSFCLYANLGFRPVGCTTAFFGTVEPDAGFQAASSLSISLHGISCRKMEQADVKACGDMYYKGMGYSRENDIASMLARFPDGCWVATASKDKRTILGYVTGLFLLGHAMATSEEAWVAVMSRAIEAREGAVACISILGVQYPRLINWALAARLQLARHNWYMVIGDYQDPKDGYVWSPSIQH